MTTPIPDHRAASWLMIHIQTLLDKCGLNASPELEKFVYVVIVVAIALLIGWVVRYTILKITQKAVRLRNRPAGRELLDQHVLTKCSHVITPLVIMALIPIALKEKSEVLVITQRATVIYALVALGVGIGSVFDFLWVRYDERQNTRNLPLRGVLDIAKGILWIVITIISVSVAIDRSPAVLLTGLGAFAATLMLVFKDSILGFVAGIQLSQNDMLRVGDWIVVPSTLADGIVIDVSLTTVKVRNWNNTIITLPPYSLVSNSFQNWRGMQDSGYRLIQRQAIIDVSSVGPISGARVDEIVGKLPLLHDFVEQTRKLGKPTYDPGVACVNGTIDTNLGLLRAYMCAWLLQHPLIGKDQQILVRLMTPDSSGWPLQIYCYSTTAWTAYEAVQSEIFEHLATVAPLFGLRLFNEVAGTDVTSLGAAQPIGQNLINKV